MDRPRAQPIAAIIDVCRDCNSRCAYCNDWERSHSDRLDLAIVEQALRDLQCLRIKCVCFSGGEPLLHQDVDQCISYAAELGIAPWLITNGIRLTDNRLQKLVIAGLKCCLLSIDSLDARIYRVLRGVPFPIAQRALGVLEKAAKNHPGLDVILNCVITRANVHSVPKLVEFAEARGFYVLFQPYESRVMSLPPNRDSLRLREADLAAVDRLVTWLIARQSSGKAILNTPFFLEHMTNYVLSRAMPQGFVCQAGDLTVCVGSDGHLYPCWHLAPVGDIRHRGLLALWYGEDFERVRATMRALDCPTCWTSCHLDMAHTIETLAGRVTRTRDGY